MSKYVTGYIYKESQDLSDFVDVFEELIPEDIYDDQELNFDDQLTTETITVE